MEFNWEKLSAYFPNPKRAIKTYKFEQEMIRKFQTMSNVAWCDKNIRDFAFDVFMHLKNHVQQERAKNG